MTRRLSWFAWFLLIALLGTGCSHDEKSVNQNKEKPQPAAPQPAAK